MRPELSGQEFRLAFTLDSGFRRNDKKEPCLSNARHSAEPQIGSGASAWVQFEVFKKQRLSISNDVLTKMDSLFNRCIKIS